MLKISAALACVAFSSVAFAGTDRAPQTTGAAGTTPAFVKEASDEVQAFDVYDDITESIFEGFRMYHPYECRSFFVRKQRADGVTYVDKLRRCD